MSLVSGPGRAAGKISDQKLCLEKHIDYIKKLDSVRRPYSYRVTSLGEETVDRCS